MPTVFSHAVIGLAVAEVAAGRRPDPALRVAAVVASAVPDLDYPLFHSLDVGGDGLWGHRGWTHGLPFAVALALLVAWVFLRRRPLPWWRAAVALALAVATHGLLDAMTDGGSGIAFLAPFSDARTFFSWRPIPVAPLSVRGIFTWYGQAVLRWEAVHLVLPALAVLVLATLARAAGRRRTA